jgi:tyrosyl-tRNA synthetase
MAIKASTILFGKSTSDDLMSLDEDTFLSVFKGVPSFSISKRNLSDDILDFLAVKTSVFQSKGEARRMINSNAVSINKDKISADFKLSDSILINEKYILIQKGKKNYFLIIVE